MPEVSGPSGDETVDGPAPLKRDGRPAAGAAARPPHAEPQQIGSYRVVEKIGEGGMGVVYKAEQRQPVRRMVALKVIKLGMDTREVVARFEAERQALALMDHPNVAKVLDAGATEQGRPFFAMELVPGVPLTTYCDRNRLDTRQRLQLLIPVCQAIQHAHQKGIIHRDLKPSNILVTMFDGKPVPKVIDFGIAKATNQHLSQHTLYTRSGSLIGTPEYMSPEQAQTGGLDVDTRSDVYSLGVILYELLTGTLPFDAEQLRRAGPDGMARLIQETEPPKPSTRLTTLSAAAGAAAPAAGTPNARDPRAVAREIRGDLDWITLKAMAKDRTRRYETANGLAMDICRHLDCEPVAARPPSTAYRLSKFARKHRAGVAATAAVALALVAGLATASFGMARAMRARADEQRQRQAAESANDQAIAALRLLRDMSDDRAGGAEARARLAEPSDRLDAGWLRDQPDTHVTVRTVLGRTYLRLDALDEARHQFEAAVRVNREAHGRPGGVDTADAAWALRGIGWIVLQRGEYAAAEQYMLQALEAYRSSGEPGRSDVVDLLHALSYGRTLRDDVVAAGRFRVEALAEQEAVLSQRIAFQPDHAESYYARGEVRARRGRIREAQPDLVRARDPGNHRTLYLLSVVNIYLGDDGAYRQSAREMYDRFIESDVREVGERTAKTCLLTPAPVGDLAALSRALDRALAPSQDVSVVGWFRLSKALLELRAGRHADAIAWADKALHSNAVPLATLDFIRAMAHWHLGNKADARAWLGRGAERVSSQVTRFGEDDLKEPPESHLACLLLHREAEALINGRAPAAVPGTRPVDEMPRGN